jgi:TPR repeat protein
MRPIAILFLSASLLLPGCTARQPPAAVSDYNQGVAAYRTKDYAAARQHWSRAVDADQTTAFNNLGFLLHEGLGGARDQARAVALWTTAARRGHTEAAWHLGKTFADGAGTGKSVVEAYAWYRCAAAPRAGGDDVDALVAADARKSLAKLLPRLTPAQFEAAEKLASAYLAKYAHNSAAQ